MKSIYSLIFIALMGFLMFSGAALIMNKSLLNGNLDDESINIINKYDTKLGDFNSSVGTLTTGDDRIDPDYQPDNNNLDEFFKEYGEHKNRIDQLRDGIKLIYKLPEIIIIAVPFIDDTDLGIYLIVIWLMIGVIITISIIKALAQKKVDEE